MRLASPLDLTMRPTHTRRGLSGKPLYAVLLTDIQKHTLKHTDVLAGFTSAVAITYTEGQCIVDTHSVCSVFLRITQSKKEYCTGKTYVNILVVSSDSGHYGNLITSVLSAESLKNKSSSVPTFSSTMQPCLQFHTEISPFYFSLVKRHHDTTVSINKSDNHQNVFWSVEWVLANTTDLCHNYKKSNCTH